MGLFHHSLLEQLEHTLKEIEVKNRQLLKLFPTDAEQRKKVLLKVFYQKVDELDDTIHDIDQEIALLLKQLHLLYQELLQVKEKIDPFRNEILRLKSTIPGEHFELTDALLSELKRFHSDLMLVNAFLEHEEATLKKEKERL